MKYHPQYIENIFVLHPRFKRDAYITFQIVKEGQETDFNEQNTRSLNEEPFELFIHLFQSTVEEIDSIYADVLIHSTKLKALSEELEKFKSELVSCKSEMAFRNLCITKQYHSEEIKLLCENWQSICPAMIKISEDLITFFHQAHKEGKSIHMMGV